jgi:hypothetical protein
MFIKATINENAISEATPTNLPPSELMASAAVAYWYLVEDVDTTFENALVRKWMLVLISWAADTL